MHCNLKLSNVAPVVLCFNYATGDALAYKFKTSATSFAFCDLDFLSRTDIFGIGSHLPVFWPV